MIDLMKEWAELEPERCEYYDASDRVDFAVLFDFKMKGSEHYPGEEFKPRVVGQIQLAAQQAIEARGWDWQTGRHDGEYRATIWHGGDDWTVSEGASVAEALLSAYLQALRKRASVEVEA
jgi:hypothetical protein